jgi:hypothetical protein
VGLDGLLTAVVYMGSARGTRNSLLGWGSLFGRIGPVEHPVEHDRLVLEGHRRTLVWVVSSVATSTSTVASTLRARDVTLVAVGAAAIRRGWGARVVVAVRGVDTMGESLRLHPLDPRNVAWNHWVNSSSDGPPLAHTT